MSTTVTTVTARAEQVIAQAQDIRDTVLDYEDYRAHARVLATAVDMAKTAREGEHQGFTWAESEVESAERMIEMAGRFYTGILLAAV